MGVEFVIEFQNPTVKLKKKVSDIMSNFIENTKLVYVGIKPYFAGNFRGLLHPYDYFMAQLFRRYVPEWISISSDTYVRTNPTLPLRLNQVEKFSVDKPLSTEIKQILISKANSIYEEVVNAEDFDESASAIRFSVAGDFDSLIIENSSAAGYPILQVLNVELLKMKLL
jgi:hypothetical protein